MLTPEYLEAMPEPVLTLYREAELAILRNMAERIAKYDYWIPTADWQNMKLKEAGITQEEILRILSQYTGKTEEALRELMQQATTEGLRSDVAVYEAAGETVPPISESEPLVQTLNAGFRATRQTMRNLTKTTANTATQQFERALDAAWMQVRSGAMSYDQAIRNAVKGLAQSGVESIRYPSGRVDTLEVATRRAVVTGVNQTTLQLQEQLADEMKFDLVEVSAHAGARPSHAEWQGEIYSRSGTSKKYPSLVEKTGYGTGAGLGGWNCRHSFSPWFEGSPRTYSKELLDSYNERSISYDGKMLTEYEASQVQRSIERNIRKWKREFEALDAAGLDTSEAAARLKIWQDRMKDFTKQTGLKRQSAREQIVKTASKGLKAVKSGGTINLAKPTDSMFLISEEGKTTFTLQEVVEEMETSPVGKKVLGWISEGKARIAFYEDEDGGGNRGWQQGDNISIFPRNIANVRVAAQTVIHEMTHHHYGIGNSQHAETICFGMEKLHLTGNEKLTPAEWEQIKKLVVDAYPEFEWEDGGYGNLRDIKIVD